MSKWTKANEYVPVTKGSTAVITLQSDGDVYGYMDASTTGVLLASASAGVAKVPTGSFSKITCTAPFILTTESAMSRLRGGHGGTTGGGAGNDWITINNDTEAVLDFPAESNEAIELLSLSCSRFTKITGNTGGKTNCHLLFNNISTLKYIDIDIPNAESIDSLLVNNSNLTYASVRAPKAKTGTYAFNNIYIMTSISVSFPEMLDASYMFNNMPKCKTYYFFLPVCANIKGLFATTGHLATSITFNIASIATIAFVSTASASVGNLTALENVTVLDGGLASCTSFIITNSTNLTDESIQNIIDALPDYSGSETSALVSFPPDRLSTEQQAQLTNKGWTWS